jgi:hypothetical protein
MARSEMKCMMAVTMTRIKRRSVADRALEVWEEELNLKRALNEGMRARREGGDWTRPSHLYLYGVVYEQ